MSDQKQASSKPTSGQMADGYVKFGPDMAGDVIALVRAVNSPDHVIVKTGIAVMDEDITIGGGSVTVVAARPSHGKSMMMKLLARSVMRDIMARGDVPGSPKDVVVYVTLEEPSESLYMGIGGHLPYSYRDIHRGEVTDSMEEVVRILQGVKILGNLVVMEYPGLVDGHVAPPISTEQIVSVVERLVNTYNMRPRAILVDYLQKLSAGYKLGRDSNRTDIVTAASNGMTMLSKAYKCPVIVAVQAGRNVDTRAIKVPTMSDMQHASSIEQDAHTILGLWRPVIDGETTVNVNGSEISVTNQTMLVRVVKSRADGAGGKLYAMNFDPVTLNAYWIDPALDSVGGPTLGDSNDSWVVKARRALEAGRV